MSSVTVRLRNKSSGVLSAPVDIAYQVVSGVVHGRQLTRATVGPVGSLQPSGPVVTSHNGQTFEGLDIAGYVDVRHDVTLINCRVVGDVSVGNAGYTVKHQRDLGRTVTLRHCAIITRSPNTKGLVSWGHGFTDAEDCLFAGGTDNVFLKPNTPGPDGFAHRFVRCWFGDIQRIPGSHSDAIQIDGGAGGVLIDRCSVNAFSLPAGEDPTTAQADVTSRASGGVILTYPSSNPEQIHRVHIVDSYLDGGNYTLETGPPDGPTATDVVVRGCEFGLHHTYGPIHRRVGQTYGGNRWAHTGTTTTGLAVTAGQPVP